MSIPEYSLQLKKSFGDYIKRLREAKSLNQKALAKMAGTTSAAISDWENAKALPDILSLVKISPILGLKPWILLEQGMQEAEGMLPPPVAKQEGGSYESATLPARLEDAGGQERQILRLVRNRDGDGLTEHCLVRIRAMASLERWQILEVVAELLDRLAESRKDAAPGRRKRGLRKVG